MKTMTRKSPNKNIYRFTLYQIDPDICDESRQLLFCSYNSLLQQKKQINPSHYQKVYEGEVTGESRAALDTLWFRFNGFLPADFAGRSMSISDIVVLERNQKQTPFYVDTFGFQKLDRRIKMED